MISWWFLIHLFGIILSVGALFFPARTSSIPSSLLKASTQKDVLFTVLTKPQSRENERRVNELIAELGYQAKMQPRLYKKKLSTGESYRTVWSTVTASSPLGWILRQPSSVVLGGDSWQVLAKDGKSSENVVSWKVGGTNIRMIGLADLYPLRGKNGYDLIIRGLEFRLCNTGNVPEKDGKIGDLARREGIFYGPFLLKDNEALRNGIGTMEVIYNDGTVRITEDRIQKNKYIHILEPYADEVISQIYSSTYGSYCEGMEETSTLNASQSGLGPWLERRIGPGGMKAIGLMSVTPYVLFILKFIVHN